MYELKLYPKNLQEQDVKSIQFQDKYPDSLFEWLREHANIASKREKSNKGNTVSYGLFAARTTTEEEIPKFLLYIAHDNSDSVVVQTFFSAVGIPKDTDFSFYGVMLKVLQEQDVEWFDIAEANKQKKISINETTNIDIHFMPYDLNSQKSKILHLIPFENIQNNNIYEIMKKYTNTVLQAGGREDVVVSNVAKAAEDFVDNYTREQLEEINRTKKAKESAFIQSLIKNNCNK